MGYTHYWHTKRDVTPELLVEAARKMRPIVREGDGVLAGWDGTGRPSTDEDGLVRFNGREEVLGDALRLYSDGGPAAFSDAAVVDLFFRTLDETPPRIADDN